MIEHEHPRRTASWTTPLVLAIVVPATVLAPLLGSPLKADDRFNILRFGAQYSSDRLGLLRDAWGSIDFYLNLGNFRPLGRVLEHSLDTMAFTIAETLGLPVFVATRVTHLLSAVVLSLVLVLFVETMTRRVPLRAAGPSAAAVLVPFVFAVGLVASARSSTIVVFLDLYALSAAVLLLLAAAAARTAAFGAAGTGPRAGAALLVAAVVGASAAAFNEFGYLAAGLAPLAFLTRGRATLALGWRALLATRGVRELGAGLAGFAAVFVPIRLEVVRRCAEFTCYGNSELALGPDLPGALVHRLLTALPGTGWRVAVPDGEPWIVPDRIGTLLLLAVLTACAVAGGRALRAARPIEPPAIVGLGVVGLATVGAGALLASASAAVQRSVGGWPIGTGWREAPLAAAGMALLVTGLLVVLAHAATRRGHGARTSWIVAIPAAAAALTLLANLAFVDADLEREDSALHARLDLSVSHADLTDAGDAARCALFDEFRELYPDREDWHVRMGLALDQAMQRLHARDYCQGDVGA